MSASLVKKFDSFTEDDTNYFEHWVQKEQTCRYVTVDNICTEAKEYYQWMYGSELKFTLMRFTKKDCTIFLSQYGIEFDTNDFKRAAWANANAIIKKRATVENRIPWFEVKQLLCDIYLCRGFTDHADSYWVKEVCSFSKHSPGIRKLIYTHAEFRWDDYRKMCQINQEINSPALLPSEIVEDWRAEFQKEASGYAPAYIFNADETNVKFFIQEKSTLISAMVILACNGDDSRRMDPYFIFAKDDEALVNRYFSGNKNVVITPSGSLFGATYLDWIDKFKDFSSSITSSHDIVLVIDNCTPHGTQDVLNKLKHLTNTKVLRTKPRMTDKLQPLDTGIIQAFKSMLGDLRYTHKDKGPVRLPLVKAVEWIGRVWQKEIESHVFKDAFEKGLGL
ncbi:hypothetical protein GGI24_005158 [Coemansia furcata]|nr:hypothetical protein GGI24_005158 [Coemansia furcata]